MQSSLLIVLIILVVILIAITSFLVYKNYSKNNITNVGNDATLVQKNLDLQLTNLKENMQQNLLRINNIDNKFHQDFIKINTEFSNLTKELNTYFQESIKSFSTIKATQENSLQENTKTNKFVASLEKTFIDKKRRGDWGELLLKNILEDIAGEHNPSMVNYQVKYDNYKPDATFKLSDDSIAIIDAKLPIFTSIESEFGKNIKIHIKKLEEYYKIDKNIKIVILFISSEATYYEILKFKNNELIKFAFTKNILITSPTTLPAILDLLNKSALIYKINKNFFTFKSKWEKVINEVNAIGKSISDEEKYFLKYTNERNQLKSKLSSLTKNIDKLIKE